MRTAFCVYIDLVIVIRRSVRRRAAVRDAKPAKPNQDPLGPAGFQSLYIREAATIVFMCVFGPHSIRKCAPLVCP